MFISKDKYDLLNYDIKSIRDDLNRLRIKHWELSHAHYKLLDHLGLREVTVHEYIDLLPKSAKQEPPK